MKMRKNRSHRKYMVSRYNFSFRKGAIAVGLLLLILIQACEKFLSPDLPNIALTDEIFMEWDEYRSAGLGLYALQQTLVDQMFVLGEVRADMLILTENSTAALEEVAHYEFNPDNEFMTPKGFYRLIAGSNALAVKLEENHSGIFEKLDSIAPDKLYEYERNYIGLYSEVLCMRAWAYFNMVRIFGEVPYLPQELKTEEEINNYVLSDADESYKDLYAIVDLFTEQLETFIGNDMIGVNYNSEGINDDTWNVTTWKKWSYYALMGQMFLTTENYPRAIEFFEKIIYSQTGDYYFLNLKQYDLAGYNEDELKYRPNNDYWKRMFSAFDMDEHMMAIWFNKERKQQNRLQYFLSNKGINIYALAPAPLSIRNWESQWHNALFVRNEVDPEDMNMVEFGDPGDFVRGHGASFAYMRNGIMMSDEENDYMLDLKKNGMFAEVENYMHGVDTVVYKYSIGKDPYDQDAHYSIFRAGSVHLYYAEALNAVGRFRDAEDIINRGIAFGESSVSGVRRRAYLSFKKTFNLTPKQYVDEGIEILDIMPVHDPYTNQIIGFRNYAGQQSAKTFLRDSLIIRERALECAWEGERFYDLVRMAERWDTPAFLADKVAAKYPAGRREEIKSLLMNKENWYLPYFKTSGK